MDPLATSSRWNESFSYISSGLFNLTRWALNCPPPKPKSTFYFSAPAPTAPDITVSGIFSTLSIDIFAVFFTCLAAYFLQWIINYFVRFCASLGYVLSGADHRDSISAPPTPPEIAPVPVSKQDSMDIAHTPVKMNEPVDCSVSHSAILATRRNSSVSSSLQDGRNEAGNESLSGELTENSGHENVICVYGGSDKLSGKFTVADGWTEFIWLGDDPEEVLSVTGSFLGFSMSFPLTFDNGKLRLKMQLPPGDHEYQFITAENT